VDAGTGRQVVDEKQFGCWSGPEATFAPVRAESEERADAWWRVLLGVGDELWSEVTVQHPHGRLGSYDGWYVAWRGSGVHVSAPTTADADDVASLAGESAVVLQQPDFWHAFGRQRGLQVRGPSVHAYLDVDPGPSDRVATSSVAELEELHVEVGEADWEESGFADSPPVVFVLRDHGRQVAAANLNVLDGIPRDIGVLVAPHARGLGLASELGGHAASYAIRDSGLARWAAHVGNEASLRTGARLGFEPYVTQLSVRP
jgi:GNAT superfamily N-acetyltransferase